MHLLFGLSLCRQDRVSHRSIFLRAGLLQVLSGQRGQWAVVDGAALDHSGLGLPSVGAPFSPGDHKSGSYWVLPSQMRGRPSAQHGVEGVEGGWRLRC